MSKAIQEAQALSVFIEREMLIVNLVDGRTMIVPLDWFPRLWHGTPKERDHYEISGDGMHIHWPDLDEDLTVAGLLAGWRSEEGTQSLKKWMASRKKATTKKTASRKG